MIRFRVPIEDVDNTIIGPTVVSIFNRLKTVFHLDKNSHLTIKNSEIDYINKNWNIGDKTNIEMNSNRLTEIELDYNLNYNELRKNSVNYRDNNVTPILYSDETKFKVSVLYFDINLNVNFKIRAKSKSVLSNLLNEIRIRYVTGRDIISHDLVYTYYLNTFFKTLISNFTYNKNITYKTDLTPSEYLAELIDDRFTYLGVMDNDFKKVSLGFKEIQSGILGRFENDLIETKKNYDKETGYWETAFEYTLQFKLPAFYDVEYYKIAYQYELDKAFTTIMTTEKDPFGRKEEHEKLLSIFAFNDYEKTVLEKVKFNYLRVPESDNDSNINDLEYYSNIYSVLFTITDDNSNVIYNLRDDIGFKLDKNIIIMLEETEWEYSSNLFRSIFNVSLYCFNKKLPDDYIEIDKNLNVVLKKELNKNCIYRVVFSLNNNLNVLLNSDKNRIVKLYGSYLDGLLELFEFLEYKSNIISLGRNKMFIYQRSKIISHLIKGLK